MHLIDTSENIVAAIAKESPEVYDILCYTASMIPFTKRQIDPWQAATLYVLAQRYDKPGARILEIGTAWGYSAAILAQGAPQTEITTLNPKDLEVEVAEKNLRPFRNVTVIQTCSWDYLESQDAAGPFDMVFVDGDHKLVEKDFPWWHRIVDGGLMLFHDYSPLGAKRACPVVVEKVNEFKAKLGREFDVVVINEHKTGMVGIYR